MKKRILGIILAILMIAALLPMAALADGEVAEVNGVGYTTLQAAVNAANDGDTVKLLADVSVNDEFVSVTKGITIDFGAFKLSGVNDNVAPQALLQVKAPGKTVTLKGTTGGIDAQADTYGTRAIAIEQGSKLVIEGGVYSSMNNCTIYADNAGVELVMTGGEINTRFTNVGNYKESIRIKGDLTIANATIKNEATNAAGNVIDEKADNAKVSIIDSKIDAKNITAAVAATSTSTVEIKGTEVTTTSANLVNGGNITIGEGTKFESTSGRVVSGATTAKIEGGSFKTDSSNGAFGYSSFPLDIEGGSFEVTKLTSGAGSTNLKISGGEFEIKDETNAKQVKENYLAPTEEGGEVQVEINETAYTVNEEGEVKEFIPVAKIGEKEYDSLAKAMNAAKAGETVELLCDIDLAGENWTPIADFKATLDGKDFTIKNMTVNDTAHAYAGFVCLLSGTIKNVTFDNASVTGLRVGVVAGSNGAWTNAVIENVKVTNSAVYGEQKCGGIMGFVRGVDNTGVGSLTVKNCTVENLVFDEYKADETIAQAGGLLGYVDCGVNLTVEGCSVKDIVINNDWYSSDEGKKYNNPLYASNEFIGVVDNKVTGSVKDYDQFTIALTGNSVSGELNDIRREACNEECSLIGGYYNFCDDSGKNPTKIVVDEAELTDELAINKEAALAELDELAQTFTTVEAKAVIDEAKAAVAAAETVEEVEAIMANVETDANEAEAAAIAAAELAIAKVAAVGEFNKYVAKLGITDKDFVNAQIATIKEQVNTDAVAAALIAAEDAADGYLANVKNEAIAQLKAVVGDNIGKKGVEEMLNSYIDQIKAAKSINEVNSIAASAKSALEQQIEIADEGIIISAIRSLVNFTERGNQTQVNKVMGIIKPILGIFGIR